MITEKIVQKEVWNDFLAYRRAGGHLTKKEDARLTEFIENEEYLSAAQRISLGGCFSVPAIAYVNKGSSNKKRAVFILPEDECYIQKLMSYLLLEYDSLFTPNLYSFRRNMGVKKAIERLKAAKIGEKYSFKIDVSDYFNSVPTEKIIPMLHCALPGEKPFTDCISRFLSEELALKDSQPVAVRKGIMAGTPVSAFLANLYLREMDAHFYEQGVLYARYSDDIIVFADTPEELEKHRAYILSFIADAQLGINPDKVVCTSPGDTVTFLGFKFCGGRADVSDIALKKIKAKMKRKANALIRWKNRKNADPERAVAAFIRHFNKKFFDNSLNSETTWCRWFFPIIETDESLHKIDEYMQECIRYIATQSRTKSRYNFRYEDMKKLGYKSLVNAYHRFREKGEYPTV